MEIKIIKGPTNYTAWWQVNKNYFKIQWCMSFTEKMVVAKISAKAMHSVKVMQVI